MCPAWSSLSIRVQHSSHFLQCFSLPCLLLLHRNRCVTSVRLTPCDPVNCNRWIIVTCVFIFVIGSIQHSFWNQLHKTLFRPCQPGDGDVEGAGQDGGHGDAEGGRGGRYWGGLPEVCRRHQGARGSHEEHGEIYILESLPLGEKSLRTAKHENIWL